MGCKLYLKIFQRLVGKGKPCKCYFAFIIKRERGRERWRSVSAHCFSLPLSIHRISSAPTQSDKRPLFASNLELAGHLKRGPQLRGPRSPTAPIGSEPPTLHDSLYPGTGFLSCLSSGRIKWHGFLFHHNLYKPNFANNGFLSNL